MTLPPNAEEVCVLVAASCTIAWIDQEHGALWLCPSGVLRVPLGPQLTLEHGDRPTVDPAMPWEATWTWEQLQDAARNGGPGFRWYPRTSIARASFRPGPESHALELVLGDRTRAKFVWLAADGGTELVEEWIAAG
jgi:hypothetical protein